ncbi:MAG: hypothetical protein ACM3SM_02600 [Bacteroidota bacterium]
MKRTLLAVIAAAAIIIPGAVFAGMYYGHAEFAVPVLSRSLLIKLFVIADISILALLVVMWKRRKRNIRKAEKKFLKNNISKLREEKVLVRRDKSMGLLRSKLQTSSNIGRLNSKAKVKEAKKMSISTGELELAAKIKELNNLKNTG